MDCCQWEPQVENFGKQKTLVNKKTWNWPLLRIRPRVSVRLWASQRLRCTCSFRYVLRSTESVLQPPYNWKVFSVKTHAISAIVYDIWRSKQAIYRVTFEDRKAQVASASFDFLFLRDVRSMNCLLNSLEFLVSSSSWPLLTSIRPRPDY